MKKKRGGKVREWVGRGDDRHNQPWEFGTTCTATTVSAKDGVVVSRVASYMMPLRRAQMVGWEGRGASRRSGDREDRRKGGGVGKR